jgi:hypothetical protein
MDEGFAPGIGEKLRSYVYLLVDPRTGRAFFAGRGRNDRCFRHVQAARVEHETTPVAAGVVEPSAADGSETGAKGESRNVRGGGRRFPVLDRIRNIEASGRSVRIDILRHGLNPDEARLVEATTRDALGLQIGSPDRSGGAASPTGPPGTRRALPNQRTEAATLNTLLAKPAKIKRNHRVVLLRLGKSFGPATSDVELEQAVRSPWKIGRRWTDPQSRRSPQWAFVVVDDVVRGVYRIDGWKQAVPASSTQPFSTQPFSTQPSSTQPSSTQPSSTQPSSTQPSSTQPSSTQPARWALAGERDPELEGKYRGRNVSAYLSSGSQNPVTYVWCGPHWVNNPA